jgi:prepilin-type N-terminal cleavage/methylation domain-containing protein
MNKNRGEIMKKRRTGFTLIELLAVIVILAVIALIATASIIQIIDRSERGALEDSAYGIIEAGNVFYIDHVLPSVNEISEDRMNFEVIGGKFVNVKNKEEKLEFKGSMPKSGKLQIYANGLAAIAICNHKYCACKSIEDTRVTVQREDCEIDEDTGEIGKKKDTTPIGTVISYMGSTTPPDGYLACDGTIYKISEYPKLAEQIKEGFGTYNYYGGDGTTTFAVPDLRGEFLRGTGTNGHSGQGNGLSIGGHQDSTYIPHVYYYDSGSKVYGVATSNRNLTNQAHTYDTLISNTGRYLDMGSTTNSNSRQNTVGGTIRPTNTSVLYCMKY